MKTLILIITLFATLTAWAEPATDAGQGNIQTKIDQTNVLLQQLIDASGGGETNALLQQLIDASGGGGAPTTDTWLFILPIAPATCTVTIESFSGGVDQLRWNGTELRKEYVETRTSSIRVSDMPVSYDPVDSQNFMFQLFLRLNGLDFSTPLPLATDGLHLDCRAANKLVLGARAYP